MKNCIIFTTKHGSTEKAALLLKEKINAEIDIINLNEVKKSDISKYDTVILGASVYIGKMAHRINELYADFFLIRIIAERY